MNSNQKPQPQQPQRDKVPAWGSYFSPRKDNGEYRDVRAEMFEKGLL